MRFSTLYRKGLQPCCSQGGLPQKGATWGLRASGRTVCGLQPTSPTDVTFQPHGTTQGSQNTPRNFCSFLRSSCSCFQNFLCFSQDPLHPDCHSGCSSVAPPEGGLLQHPFHPIILRVFLRALTPRPEGTSPQSPPS